MAFTKTWDETAPGGSDSPRQGDDEIRTDKFAVRERMAVEHHAAADESGATVVDKVWRHKKAADRTNYGLAANKPSTIATGMVDGAGYYETDTGKTVYYDDTEADWIEQASSTHDGLTRTYTTGTITVVNASATITGASTAWGATNIAAGDVLIGPDGEYYAISSVDSTTQITLDRNYNGTTNPVGQAYVIELHEHSQYVRKSGETIDGPITLGTALAMGANKVTGLADGTAATDAAAYGQLPILGFAIGTYTGDGNADRAITGVGFQPSVLILYEHAEHVGAQVMIKTSSDALYTKFTGGGWKTDIVVSLDADGFTLSATAGDPINYVNENAASYTYIAIQSA